MDDPKLSKSRHRFVEGMAGGALAAFAVPTAAQPAEAPAAGTQLSAPPIFPSSSGRGRV